MKIFKNNNATFLTKLLALLLISCLITVSSLFVIFYFNRTSPTDFVVKGYLAEWSFNDEKNLQVYDFKALTHVYFAFILIDENTLTPVLTEEKGFKLQLLSNEIKRQNASTKIILSIGGGGAKYFCESSKTDVLRQNFAKACKNIMLQYNIDGFDVDWEYPGISHEGITKCSGCKSDHYKLLKSVRDEIGFDKLLTIAVGASVFMPQKLHSLKLSKILDYVNIMNYDYNNTNHASFSFTKNAVFRWHLAGFKKSQIILGVPFYARSDNKDYQFKKYDYFKSLQAKENAKLVTKKDQTYFLINDVKISVDTPSRITEKSNWAKQMGYGGIFCWQLGFDVDNELLYAMNGN